MIFDGFDYFLNAGRKDDAVEPEMEVNMPNFGRSFLGYLVALHAGCGYWRSLLREYPIASLLRR